MKTRTMAVQSTLDMTENRAKVCQVLVHSPSSHEQYRAHRVDIAFPVFTMGPVRSRNRREKIL
jgi:hypothetical protein